MNRRKSSRNLSFGSVLLLVLAAVLVAGAGVFHACVKNRQIEIARSIEKAESRIDQLDNDTLTLQMYLDSHLNRFKIGERLKQLGSDLIAIDVNVLESVNVETGHSVLIATGAEGAGAARSGETGEPLPNLVQSGP